ncbi:ras-specific guanine nucleotide-releasing factor 2-like isoform X2 [Lineus longissimus]|uniref:ras-specific guanine nucleotide-releasing factor 2-like isoform X2 n=1 Tax=Lineus longissimus TaxID=88925 RepID=UPI00315DBC9F
MQKAIRLNENQLLHLAAKARQENTLNGYLYKKSTDTGKWQLRWFALYQNCLFYYENESTPKPSGVALLEGCYCERLITPSSVKGKDNEKQYSFAIYYRPEGLRQYELRTDTETECNAWVDAIKQASYSKVLEQKEELEQKHLHLLQILDSERQAKWHYVQQTEELTTEVKKLKNEVRKLKEFKNELKTSNHMLKEEESDEIKKIKKVQSFFRGWLCRRRWKQIVDEYIRSEHAESMRKRNSIVFGMVECEEEYVRQLSTLVSCFLRPFKMAASSKKPPITHDDVNSIFLNSETVVFLHQIFLKALTARMENWPTLVLGDLFDMLLPMLGIYQEYVRNHHFSLQVLAEYKQKQEFNTLLKRYEEKPACEGRSLETFLTYPMHQIPRYIITLHELLAHTPHDHVERKKLEYAKSKLEELSHIMHDEVSETENIRKNLAIERMIVEGCDILLDVNQTFVRQGSLLQVLNDRSKSGRGRLGSFGSSFKESKKEQVRQVFLFTYHLLLTTRASNGRLHLCKHYGKVPLADCTLVEDSSSDVFFFDDDTSSLDSQANSGSTTNLLSTQSCEQRERMDYSGLDFRLIVDTKSGPPVTITLVASTLQEKAAWCSDISQCIENLHYSDLLNSSMSDTSSVTMPQSVSRAYYCSQLCSKNPPSPDIARLKHSLECDCNLKRLRSDPKLFRDDEEIKFSRTLNSCKVPQIRHASTERLLERLTDLRFLSIDFLNTFLLTYRVFTTGRHVLEALRRVVINPEYGNLDHKRYSTISVPPAFEHHSEVFHSSSPPSGMTFSQSPPNSKLLIKPQPEKARRISTGMMKIEVTGEVSHLDGKNSHFRRYHGPGGTKGHGSGSVDHGSLPPYEKQHSREKIDSRIDSLDELHPPKTKLAPIASCETLSDMVVTDADVVEAVTIAAADQPSSPPPIITTEDADVTESTTTITFSEPEAGESSTDPAPAADLVMDSPDDSPVDLFIEPDNGGVGPSPLTTLSSAPSSDTLTPGSPASSSPVSTPAITPMKSAIKNPNKVDMKPKKLIDVPPIKIPASLDVTQTLSPVASPKLRRASSPVRGTPSPIRSISPCRASSPSITVPAVIKSPCGSPKLKRAPSPISYSFSSPSINIASVRRGSSKPEIDSVSTFSPRGSFAVAEGSPPTAKAGAVVTSSRASKRSLMTQLAQLNARRSSSTAAASAFAIATAGASNPPSGHPRGIGRFNSAGSSLTIFGNQHGRLSVASTGPCDLKPYLQKRQSVISTAATMRVLNVLKHWVSKHSQDFESDFTLKKQVQDLLEEMVCNANLLPAEHKAAASILRTIMKDDVDPKKVDLKALLNSPSSPSKDSFDSLSALDIAEQLTYLDHQIFKSIRSEELLGQAWMKPDKANKAPHVLLVSKRFNEVSRLVVSEIVGRCGIMDRVACIEKWAAIADICRCMHNYNGVLQICAAFVNSSVYRLKRTWDRLPKQTKQMIEKLQTLVSSDGRFKNMRDALHRCDPPCIPYLGMYLTDLSFIEEGTPNKTEESLVNFSKMRMIAHVIREIQLFQQTPYRIEHHPRVSSYLLDPSRLLEEEETYKASLIIEPRQSIARPLATTLPTTTS